jgi:hypothetical protein
MTFEELRAEAQKQGYRLVHRDCIRTATVSSRVDKFSLKRVGEERQREYIERGLYQRLSAFLVENQMIRVKELPHKWDMEFRADLTILEPRGPDADSPDFFIWRPLDGKERP